MNDDIDVEAQIDEFFEKLPQATREIFQNFDWESRLENLGKKYGLLLDELGILQSETMLTLFGLTLPEEFEGNLRKHMNISNTLAKTLVKDVNVSIFMPIHEQVMESQKEKIENHEMIFTAGEKITTSDRKPALNRDNILAGIEDTEKPAPKNIAEIKLEDIFSQKPKKSGDMIGSPVSYNNGDPYHEPLD